MGCDYYIQSELVIEYRDKTGRFWTLYTNRELQKCYIFDYENKDSDNDLDTSNQKYKDAIAKKIEANTYNKILFENGEWVKESYKSKYDKYLMKTYKDIVNYVKIYKKYSAWERM